MFKIFFLLILVSCNATQWKLADDIIDGEMQTGEKVIEDLRGEDSIQGKKKPAIEVRVPMKKF